MLRRPLLILLFVPLAFACDRGDQFDNDFVAGSDPVAALQSMFAPGTYQGRNCTITIGLTIYDNAFVTVQSTTGTATWSIRRDDPGCQINTVDDGFYDTDMIRCNFKSEFGRGPNPSDRIARASNDSISAYVWASPTPSDHSQVHCLRAMPLR
jgi:hypothetical protein